MYLVPRKSFGSGSFTIPQDKTEDRERFIANRTSSQLSNQFTRAVHQSEGPWPRLLGAQLQQRYYDSTILHYSPRATAMPTIGPTFLPLLIPPSQSDTLTHSIPQKPFKILEAPDLADDFYRDCLDWSCTDMISVCLGQTVFLWKASNGKTQRLCSFYSQKATSVAWNPTGNLLSVANSAGRVMIYDVETSKPISTRTPHKGRVGTLAWNESILSSGGRDRHIIHRDLRAKNDSIVKLTQHKQEVCGLKWSPDGTQLASGGNDNSLVLWSSRSHMPVAKITRHKAAVRALAWSPHHRGLLASGSGTADPSIIFWDTLTAKEMKWVETGSQVWNLMFSKYYNELISTHGYSSHHISLWKYPNMKKLARLHGHTRRVLYLAESPDGQVVATGAGTSDESIRFWKLFPRKKIKNVKAAKSYLHLPSNNIR